MSFGGGCAGRSPIFGGLPPSLVARNRSDRFGRRVRFCDHHGQWNDFAVAGIARFHVWRHTIRAVPSTRPADPNDQIASNRRSRFGFEWRPEPVRSFYGRLARRRAERRRLLLHKRLVGSRCEGVQAPR